MSMEEHWRGGYRDAEITARHSVDTDHQGYAFAPSEQLVGLQPARTRVFGQLMTLDLCATWIAA
jgi:hypothetical protein